MEELFVFGPVLLTAIGAGIALWQTVTKYRARIDLANAIQSNAQDIDLINKELATDDLEAAVGLARKYARRLSPAERREAEAALTQPSAAGRANYVRSVAAERS
jgi:hypothetical protein